MILMSILVNCKSSIVNIVNIDLKDEKKVNTEVKWIMLLIILPNCTIIGFKHLVSIDGKFLFTQP